MCSELSVALFLNGYLTVLAEECEDTKVHLLQHLKEVMEDSEIYGWTIVRDYHAAKLQHIEQGRAVWGEDNKKCQAQKIPGLEQISLQC